MGKLVLGSMTEKAKQVVAEERHERKKSSNDEEH
jgi:hypothetical protein